VSSRKQLLNTLSPLVSGLINNKARLTHACNYMENILTTVKKLKIKAFLEYNYSWQDK